jgi:hypothetical protein
MLFSSVIPQRPLIPKRIWRRVEVRNVHALVLFGKPRDKVLELPEITTIRSLIVPAG